MDADLLQVRTIFEMFTSDDASIYLSFALTEFVKMNRPVVLVSSEQAQHVFRRSWRLCDKTVRQLRPRPRGTSQDETGIKRVLRKSIKGE